MPIPDVRCLAKLPSAGAKEIDNRPLSVTTNELCADPRLLNALQLKR